MSLGEAQEATALGAVTQRVDEVLQCAVAHVWQRVAHQRLLQQEAHKRCFEGLEPEFTQALQDARYAEIVVLGPVRAAGEEFLSTAG